MVDTSLALLFLITATLFVAGVVKGVTGMGLPTVAMSVLGGLISPLAAASLLIVPAFVSNVWQLLAGPAFARTLRRLWPMMLTIMIGTIAGTRLLVGGNKDLTTSALGAALLIYAGNTLFARQLRVPARLEPSLAPLVGAITGVVTGSTGIAVIPAAPYLQSLDLEKEDLIQALGLSFTISTLALAAGLAWRGAFQVHNLAASSLGVIPALVGMWVGQIVRSKVNPQTFRRWFLICLILLGAEMLVKPFL